MTVRDIAFPEQATGWLVAGIACAQRDVRATDLFRSSLTVAQELLSTGDRIPPLGVLVDLVGWIERPESGAAADFRQSLASPLPAALIRRYQDYVVGRLIVDAALDRAAAGVLRYRGAERTRAMSFLWKCVASRTHYQGILLNPALVRHLLSRPEDMAFADMSEACRSSGVVAQLIAEYESLIRAFRGAGELLAPEDLFELEHGTAVRAFGQRLALRQVLQAAAEFEAALPLHPPESMRRGEAATTANSVEDHYPVGGFSSLSTRGSMESLLHSQLAFMEPHDRPDLFDIKYVRDELLYYSRDDNQFTRPRHTCVFAFAPDLAAARVKDRTLPFQRIVLLCGMVVAVVRGLKRWLTEESLAFHFVFLKQTDTGPLELERDLFSLIFEEEVALGLLQITDVADGQLPVWLDRLRRTSHVTSSISSTQRDDAMEGMARLVIDSFAPRLEEEPIQTAPTQPDQQPEPLHEWHVAALGVARSHLIG